MVSSVGCADCEAMALMGQRSVGLTARPRKRIFSADLLYETFVGLVEGKQGGRKFGVLFLSAIFYGCAEKMRMLWGSWFWVVELLEGFCHITQHGEVHLPLS